MRYIGIGIGAVIGFALLGSLCVGLWVLTVIGLDNAGTIHLKPGECWAGVCKGAALNKALPPAAPQGDE